MSGDSVGELGDVPPATFRRTLHQVADWIADYRESIADRPISSDTQPGELIRSLPAVGPERGEPFPVIWQDIQELIVPSVVHWGHPQFAAYFGSTTTAPGILAEMISAALNVNAMTWRTSPAATELETVVLNWLREWLGLPGSFSGVVYDTASISTMHALAAARERAAPLVRKTGLAGQARFAVYCSDQAHSSVEKAAIALGLGEENVRRIPSDCAFRLDGSALASRMKEDIAAGIQPLAVVATVGTTSTASVDPVKHIASLCREHGAWLHIDAAYGGGLALLPEDDWVKEGWAEADSLVINPHKMLFVPFDFSALYVKDIARLRKVFTLVPEYLRGDAVRADINYMDYGVQLGRRFRSLKAWMVWRTFGREGMAARIREHMRLAKLFARWVEEDGRFEVLAPVTMGVVCFGLKNDLSFKRGGSLLETLNASGKTYLTQTKLHGTNAIRLGLGNILTTEDHLREIWQMILEAVDQSAAEGLE